MAAPRNIQKYIQNTNREVQKSHQNYHSALLHIECILGIDNLEQSSILPISQDEILYYSCKNFILYNIPTKEYQIINKDVKYCQLIQMKSFNTNEKHKKLIVCLYQNRYANGLNGLNGLNGKNNTNDTTAKSTDRKVDTQNKQAVQNFNKTKDEQQTGYYLNDGNTLTTTKSINLLNQKPSKRISNATMLGTDNSLTTVSTLGSSSSNATYIGLLTIKTDYDSRTNASNVKRYDWKVCKLFSSSVTNSTSLTNSTTNTNSIQSPIRIEDINYHIKKNYLYFISSSASLPTSQTPTTTTGKILQHLHVFDLKKQILLLSHEIRSNTVGYFANRMVIEDFNQIYLMGRNYFRMWTLNFNERSMKESNTRTVERTLKGKVVVDVKEIDKYSALPEHNTQILKHLKDYQSSMHNVQTVLHTPAKLILILTQKELILAKNGELVSIVIPERNMSKQPKNKDNIEMQLQNSLNQICKMKFLFDQYQELKVKNQQKDIKKDKPINVEDEGIKFNCISACWKIQDKNIYFAIATNKFNVLIYQICDFQIRLETEYNYGTENMNSQFKTVLSAQHGDIIVLQSYNNEITVINQDNFDAQQDLSLKSLWGNGQMHPGKIWSMSSPAMQNLMCSTGQEGTFKLWSLKKNQKKIIFEEKPKEKPLGITIHPGGMILGVNFQNEIKLYSILNKEFYEVTSIKTNYSSFTLKYSPRGEFLVSNEGHIIRFYEPYTLKNIGYIQPVDLKHQIIDFQISKNSDYVCFITIDNSVYIQEIDTSDLSKWQHYIPSHTQLEPYTCFYFDYHKICTQEMNTQVTLPTSATVSKSRNIFIGATKNKYLTIYKNFGKDIIAQFPIVDCYIVDMQIHGKLFFAATSKGTIRVYHWPILEEELELEIVNINEKKIKYKAPLFQEFSFWHESIPIAKIHKLRFSSQLVVVNEQGNMAILNYQQTKGKKPIYEEVSAQYKQLEQLVNEMFYIKKSQTQKRNKLIQKTQSDILKVENEMIREKIILGRKMQEENNSVEKSFKVKAQIQEQEKKMYLQKEQKEIQQLLRQIQQKKAKLQMIKIDVTDSYNQKKMYQQYRNGQVEENIQRIITEHKQKIRQKIENHKLNIKNKKKQYLDKVKSIQNSFDSELETQMKQVILDATNSNTLTQYLSKKKGSDEGSSIGIMNRLSVCQLLNSHKQHRIKKMQEQLSDEIESQFASKQSHQIIVDSLRLEQIQQSNALLEQQIRKFKAKIQDMQRQDESYQKEFQRYLQDYNFNRFQNLSMHSEVLKMQNQLIQRKQVLDNKEGIVMLAYQEKQKLENFKELVKGSLNKLQGKKQNIREVFIKKQHDLSLIFSQLENEIHKMQNKKVQLKKAQRLIKLSQLDLQNKQKQTKEWISKLKQIKRFLLLERMNQDKQKKAAHQAQQQLLISINFLKKRIYMQSLKENKNKQIKTAALNRVLKQNKNLLEQCNQLRSEGIEYQNEIKNLSKKLKDATKMISIESKLKHQKTNVQQQKQHLQVVRQLFKLHLDQFGEVDEDDQENEDDSNDEENVHNNQDLNNNSNNNKNISSNNTSRIDNLTKDQRKRQEQQSSSLLLFNQKHIQQSKANGQMNEAHQPIKASNMNNKNIIIEGNNDQDKENHLQLQLQLETLHKPFKLSGHMPMASHHLKEEGSKNSFDQ